MKTIKRIGETAFNVVGNEEQTIFNIVLGNNIACRREFNTEKAAIKEVEKINWDLVYTFVRAIVESVTKKQEDEKEN